MEDNNGMHLDKNGAMIFTKTPEQLKRIRRLKRIDEILEDYPKLVERVDELEKLNKGEIS